MPRIFDNIDQSLLGALRETLNLSERADFCVGYFNLRGWKQIDELIDSWPGGPGNCCRLLVGMQTLPKDELRTALAVPAEPGPDQGSAVRLGKKLAQEFRDQLIYYGVPTDADERGLRRLAAQIRAKKVVVKLFLKYPLHAKLYLLFRPDPISPKVGYLGSSNLTFAGLSNQGELNIDVLDHDACNKLAKWFEERWDDRLCMDISDELAKIIEESWAREQQPPPYYIYLKMAYHLSQEALGGPKEYRVTADFANVLMDFQKAAVERAAVKLKIRGGVLIGDVVGLGKTLMATALAKIFEKVDDHTTLIICPKNLQPMWEHYREKYGLRGAVLSITRAMKELPTKTIRHRLVLIDESHNLRNREGKRYGAIRDYIVKNESKVVLLSATPFNAGMLDLGSQLRLFQAEDDDLGIRPEQLIRQLGAQFNSLQVAATTLAAFEKSTHADDWRELMKRFMVRRTRSFIMDNYAKLDPANGRRFLTFPDGRRSYFPDRIPRTLAFPIDDADPTDQYAKLYTDNVVSTINHLNLPRYGLGNYLDPNPESPPTNPEAIVIRDLSRAGKRLMGFCRTNLFKRLESSGFAFLQSIERHILRNFVYLHALENDLPLPIGTQDAAMLDSRIHDAEADLYATDEEEDPERAAELTLTTEQNLLDRAAEVYREYAGPLKRRFRWLRSKLFSTRLANDLRDDAQALLGLLHRIGAWDPSHDAKLDKLAHLLKKQHPGEKVLVFTQFADTVNYLVEQLRRRRVERVEGATGNSANPTALAWRFSPESNDKSIVVSSEQAIRVLVATDVLSEGQNLQDAAIVVNYDLPWAIIRLIQRAGRVDRIGQKAEKILCYTFLPAEGVERIIRLRARVRQRLRDNAEIVGTDEAFFEDDRNDQAIRDLFTEKADILDGEADNEVDLESQAYQIWKNAIDANPDLKGIIAKLDDVVYSTKGHVAQANRPEGVLAYVRIGKEHDALVWLDRDGNVITESQSAILRAAECKPDDPALPRLVNHHPLVQKAVELVAAQEKSLGGSLGRPSSARNRTYTRLKQYQDEIKGTLFDTLELRTTIEAIHNHPLRPVATDELNRQLRGNISDPELAQFVVNLRKDGRLSVVHEEEQERQQPHIICSLGLTKPN